MNKRVTASLVIFIALLSLAGCRDKQPAEKVEELHSPGEIVIVPNKFTVSLQNIEIIREIKLANSLENVFDFPFIYVKKGKDDTRIIKIKGDGNTVDTIVERPGSSLYQNAYIVEKGGDLSKTNASYVLDPDRPLIKPRNPKEVFAVVSFTIKNISRKSIALKDVKLSIIADEKEEKNLDLIISDIILNADFPVELEKGKSYSLRLISLVPLDSKSFIFNCEGKKFKWEVK